jgi:prevent-host-death family protein
MKKASISQAKNQLSALLEKVRHGETVLITDRGRPVARLEPVSSETNAELEAAIKELERAGVVRRPREKVNTDLLLQDPSPAPGGASALQALLEERREAR